MSRDLILGGAQLGNGYGFFVREEKIPKLDLDNLLEASLEVGILSIDIAQNYKGVIENLADVNLIDQFRISTKIEFDEIIINEYKSSLKLTLSKLNADKFESILIHNWSILDVSNRKNALDLLQNLKEIGITNKIGISVYELADLEGVSKAVQIIQAPLNFFNTKFLTSVQVKNLKTEGVEFHARSIFHQGTLLNASLIDSDFRSDIVKFEIFRNTFNLSNLEAALSVYDSQDVFTKLLVGVVKAEQLLEIVSTKENIVDFDFIGNQSMYSENFADPRKWEIRKL